MSVAKRLYDRKSAFRGRQAAGFGGLTTTQNRPK
jgi:hypothetical protein